MNYTKNLLSTGFLAVAALSAASLFGAQSAKTAGNTVLTGGCPCRNRPPQPQQKPLKDAENQALMLNVGCGCQNKRARPPKKNTGDAILQIVPVGCPCNARAQKRPVNAEAQKKNYQEVAKIAEKNRKFVGGKNAPETRDEAALQAKGWLDNSGPQIAHYLREKDPKGSLVTIEDGSIWSIYKDHQNTVKTWAANSKLTVKPAPLSFWNKLFRSKPEYKYAVVNLQNGQTVGAELSFGPLKTNQNTKTIDRIDYTRGEIYLSDRTLWRIDSSLPSMQFFQEWQRDDAVILGTNDTWFSLGNPFILINVASDNWIAATRVY